MRHTAARLHIDMHLEMESIAARQIKTKKEGALALKAKAASMMHTDNARRRNAKQTKVVIGYSLQRLQIPSFFIFCVILFKIGTY